MQLPSEFFSPQSALTLSGATAMTFVISGASQTAFNFNPRWFALAIALLITLLGTWSVEGRGLDYLFAVINGCLVYLSAVGLSSAIPEARTRGFGEQGGRGFFDHWY